MLFTNMFFLFTFYNIEILEYYTYKFEIAAIYHNNQREVYYVWISTYNEFLNGYEYELQRFCLSNKNASVVFNYFTNYFFFDNRFVLVNSNCLNFLFVAHVEHISSSPFLFNYEKIGLCNVYDKSLADSKTFFFSKFLLWTLKNVFVCFRSRVFLLVNIWLLQAAFTKQVKIVTAINLRISCRKPDVFGDLTHLCATAWSKLRQKVIKL